MTPTEAPSPAERAYNAFVATLGTGVLLQEAPRVPWADLSPDIRRAWAAAVGSVVAELTEQTLMQGPRLAARLGLEHP